MAGTAICVALLFCNVTGAQAAAPPQNVPGPEPSSADQLGQILSVKFKDDTSSTERREARDSVDGDFEQNLAAPGLQQVSIPDGGSVDAAAMELRANDNVEYVSIPGTYEAASDPAPYYNDPYLPNQWSLSNYGQVFVTEISGGQTNAISGTPGADIDAPGAWALATHEDPVPVGVVDTGVAYGHQDLAGDIFENSAEVNGTTGQDDDFDGHVDDVHGWDFYDDDADPRDLNGHGTHVASIIGAKANNNAGIAGVDPWSKIVPLRAADETGLFEWAAIEQAVTYGLAHGVRIFNGSFGGPDTDPAFDDIMEAHPNALFVFSAGNGGSDKIGDNHDAGAVSAHRYPCDATLDNVICVGASDWNDRLSSFSDYGVKSVDVVAPGSRIYAAKPCLDPSQSSECPAVTPPANPDDEIGVAGGSGAYQLLSGTSMAAPQVAGTAALIWGQYPGLNSSQVKSALVKTTDQIPSLSGKIAYGGRLDAKLAMQKAATFSPTATQDWPVPPPQPVGPGVDDGTGNGGSNGGTSTIGGSVPSGTVIPPTATPLSFTIIRPSAARIGRSSKVKFKLRCTQTCSAKVVAKTQIPGLKAFRATLKSGRAGTRAISVTIPSGRLRALRALLDEGVRQKLIFSVVVSDKAGNKSSPSVFSVKLSH